MAKQYPEEMYAVVREFYTNDNTECTLLHWAAKRDDDVRFVKLLLEMGCDICVATKDSLRMWPIHWAASDGLIANVRCLLHHAASVGGGGEEEEEGVREQLVMRDGNGSTALLVAARNGADDLVAYLIQKGANPFEVDDSGDSALHWAAYQGSVSIVALMSYSILRANDGFVPSSWNSEQQIISLQDFVDAKDLYGQTPLHLASIRGNAEVVQYLLHDLGSLSFDVKDNKGKTPLDLATKKGHKGCIIVLETYREMKRREQIRSIREKLILYGRTLCSYAEWKYWFLGGDGGHAGNPNNTRLPLFLILFTMLFSGSIYFSCIFAYENYAILADHKMLHVVSILCYVFMWIFFYLVHTTNPGIIDATTSSHQSQHRARFHHRKNTTQTKELASLARKLERDYEVALQKMGEQNHDNGEMVPSICHTCHIVKPPRSKHCRMQRKCVLMFDHYCPFVGNTVGLYNHHYFLFFLLCVQWLILTGISLLFLILRRGGTINAYSYVVTVYFLAFLAPVTALLITHLFLFSVNLTTNEFTNKERYPQFWKNGVFVNPYNRGLLHNFYMRCFPSSELYLTKSTNEENDIINENSRHTIEMV